MSDTIPQLKAIILSISMQITEIEDETNKITLLAEPFKTALFRVRLQAHIASWGCVAPHPASLSLRNLPTKPNPFLQPPPLPHSFYLALELASRDYRPFQTQLLTLNRITKALQSELRHAQRQLDKLQNRKPRPSLLD